MALTIGEFKYTGESREDIDKMIDKNGKEQLKYAQQQAEQAQAAQDKREKMLQG